MTLRTICLLLPTLLIACGDKDTTDDSTAADDSTADDSGTGNAIDCATDAWDKEADVEWQSAWMAACMVPATAPIMQGIDADRFANFSCVNCHGADLGGGTYETPASTPLDWAQSGYWDPAFYDASTYSGPMADLAATAAEVLGREPWSQSNPTGFGCASCHPGL